MTEPAGAEEARWRRVGVLRPLAIRDFALLWSGMSISLLGDGIYTVAIAWQVYQLSSSPTALSIVGVAWTVPMVLLLLVGGVISDRFERRRIVLLSEVIRGLAVGAIGALSVTGQIELWHIAALSAVYGVGEALFAPAFGPMVPDIVPPELLVQANSLDSLVRPLAARLLGPALGGLAIDAFGVGSAFLVDAASFACSGIVLLLMRRRPVAAAELTPTKLLADIGVGCRFVRSKTWIWGTLVAAAITLLVFFGPWEVLVPLVVKNGLGGSAGELGFVFAAGGAGAVLASLVMGQRELPRRTITFMYAAYTISVAGPIVYGIANALWQLMAAAAVASAGGAAGTVVWMTLVQRNVPAELLGRVTSLDWLVAVSLVPISFAVTGPVAGAIGVRETLVAAGAIAVAVQVGFLFYPGMRDLERRGDGR